MGGAGGEERGAGATLGGEEPFHAPKGTTAAAAGANGGRGEPVTARRRWDLPGKGLENGFPHVLLFQMHLC